MIFSKYNEFHELEISKGVTLTDITERVAQLVTEICIGVDRVKHSNLDTSLLLKMD